jgi:hypothetical protein
VKELAQGAGALGLFTAIFFLAPEMVIGSSNQKSSSTRNSPDHENSVNLAVFLAIGIPLEAAAVFVFAP